MYVDPGELNKQIQIIQTSDGETYDDEGHLVETTTVIRTCWAKVTNTSGKELISAGKELSEAKKRFLVRWTSAEIKTGMFVRYGGDNYDIKYVNKYHEDKRYLEIWTDDKKAVV